MTDTTTDMATELPETASITPFAPPATETNTELLADAAAPVAVVSSAPKAKNRLESAQPVLEKLFELYPQLFGQRFLPLKLGIFQELLATHPDDFKRDTLKTALGVHTRSTRYLQSVASGLKRHDLQGNPVEAVAPEHIYLSIVELFQRRQARSKDDLRPKLYAQLVAAYEQSGLSRQDYLARIGAPAEAIQVVLDDALAEVDQQRARRAALLKAYEASGKTPEAFADMLGMDLRDVKAVLQTNP
ncbi:MAG: ProQ/FINO family protein [Rhodoferax sp.]|uniref:ProQ/FINO family protein n=1 Tax=Rhodoferax sp. TaxID=50421 RepID=UPI0026351411|nr:ProQ/FINO family protein [Rhodoferax sp.]MDD2882400.1 ProQ/FINO family protein [Rhodoferax sp.]